MILFILRPFTKFQTSTMSGSGKNISNLLYLVTAEQHIVARIEDCLHTQPHTDKPREQTNTHKVIRLTRRRYESDSDQIFVFRPKCGTIPNLVVFVVFWVIWLRPCHFANAMHHCQLGKGKDKLENDFLSFDFFPLPPIPSPVDNDRKSWPAVVLVMIELDHKGHSHRIEGNFILHLANTNNFSAQILYKVNNHSDLILFEIFKIYYFF